jgi:Domain of unknown function (DUF4145)
MAKTTIVQPAYGSSAFQCPHCNTHAHQTWTALVLNDYGFLDGWTGAICSRCKDASLWRSETMEYPRVIVVEPPNPDLNPDIQRDYLEAAAIVQDSPRGAAALLRLAIQKLCKQLGQPGENINDDIATLVKNGLAVEIKEALDIVRVVGNESVHPGEIDLNDNQELAYQLFNLVNLIADRMITHPKEVNKMFAALPAKKLDGIKTRDKK